jgi:hypothetical protein
MGEGTAFTEMVNQSRVVMKNQRGSDLSGRELVDLCLEIEQDHPATPQLKLCPKKIQKIQRIGSSGAQLKGTGD